MKGPPLNTLSYTLGNSLYIPLTARCNSLTLPQTRGPTFRLPNPVVSSLLRLRKLEHHFCYPSDGVDVAVDAVDPSLHSNDKCTLPRPSHPMVQISDFTDTGIDDKRFAPIADILRQEIKEYLHPPHHTLTHKPKQSIVFAGEGEPTLRMNALSTLAKYIQQIKRPTSDDAHDHHDDPDPTVRVITNGLILAHASPSHRMQMLEEWKECGIHELSVALMTSSPTQYQELLQPCAGLPGSSHHERICDLIRDAVDVGLRVECTGVDREFVDQPLAEALGAELGAHSFRWRPYFP